VHHPVRNSAPGFVYNTQAVQYIEMLFPKVSESKLEGSLYLKCHLCSLTKRCGISHIIPVALMSLSIFAEQLLEILQWSCICTC
jgi:hypothetical protein